MGSTNRRGRVPRPAAHLVLAIVAVLALVASGALTTKASGALRGTSSRVPSPGVTSAARLPRGTSLLGAAPGAAPLTVDLVLKPRDALALARFVSGVSTPGAPSYRHYLPRGAFGPRFGPSPVTMHRVLATLRTLGLGSARVAPNRMTVTVRTTVARADRAFSTSIELFRLPSGRIAYDDAAGARVPASIAPSVASVVGLDDVLALVPAGGAVQATVHRSGVGPRTPGPQPCGGATRTGAATANVLSTAYGLNELYQRGELGGGQTIALFEAAGFSRSDVAAYQACYGTRTTVTVRPVDGGASVGTGTLEATADVEDLISTAPRAKVLVYESANFFQPNYLDEWARIVADDAAKVISDSWLACESFEPTGVAAAESVDFAQAAAQGQTVLAATGDFGSEACNQFGGSTALSVDEPASDPYVTAVGGTQWGSRAPRSGERAWRNPVGSGGGGISSNWAMPSWQTGRGVVNRFSSGTPCGAATGDCRETPDLSALSGPPYYAFYCSAGDCSTIRGWGTFYGTSFATPLLAASVALANESCTGGAPVGFLSPALYELASTSYSPLHDLTVGNTDFTGSHGGDYPATPGYDLATGLGSPMWTTGKATLGLAGQLCTLGKLAPLQRATSLLSPANAASGTGAYANGVACPSPRACVAVGSYDDASSHPQAVVTSEVAGRWARGMEVTAPAGAASNPNASLFGAACPTAASCVAVGAYDDGAGHGQAMAARESSGSWSAPAVTIASPLNAATDPAASLRGVTCTSPGTCVAVGSYVDSAGATEPMVALESGGSWARATELATPADAVTNPGAQLNGIACTSAGSCVAAGSYVNAVSRQAMVVTEAAGVWSQGRSLTPPANAGGPAVSQSIALQGVACASPGNCTAVGSYVDTSAHGQALTVAETGGHWARGRELALPVGASTDPNAALNGISCATAGGCVAVGTYTDDRANGQALVASDQGGVWARATNVVAPTSAGGNPQASLQAVACPSLGTCVGAGIFGNAAHHGQPMAASLDAPTVTRLMPDRAKARSAAPVYVIGSNLASVVAVRFGSTPARIDGIVSPSELAVFVPPGNGAVYVTVTTPYGTSARTSASRFTYVR